MAIGWVIAAVGLAFVVFPRPLMVMARGWRLGMPPATEPRGVHAARVGAAMVMIVGLVLALS